ncbi:MAG: LytR/AlgR family response regulator transcription factor [Gammaproteobacteria bacterium]
MNALAALRVLIVDDEPLARERLVALLRECGAGAAVHEAGNGLEAIEAVAAHAPDVVLMDVRMPGMDGLEAARHLGSLPTPPAVVFTTAYGDHALAAFEANAVAYLLKPIRRDKLEQALVRAAALSAAGAHVSGAAAPSGGRSHLSAVIGGNLRLVPAAEVRCFVAEQKYTTVIWPGGELPIEDSLRALEDEFGERLLRVHRNALVAVKFVQGLDRDAEGGWHVVLDGTDKRLAVSRRLLSEVRRRLRGSAP